MAAETFRRSTNLSGKIDSVLTETGYINISSSPFLGSLVGAIKDTLDTEFRSLYDIANNVDLGRAGGQYLDRWGLFLNEPREKMSFASDMSLSNVRISISPTKLAGEITTTGSGVPIPKGTQIFSSDMRYGVEILDDTVILPTRSDAYCRVVCITPGVTYIPPQTLTKMGTTLSEIEGITPSAISKYSLISTNLYEISGGSAKATDDHYRYILLKKAESIGIFNESRISSMLDIDEVVKISMQEYRGGVSIFVETKYYQNAQVIVNILRSGLKSSYVKGLNISVFPPVYRYFTGTITLTLKVEDPTREVHNKFNSEFCRLMNAVPMGEPVSIPAILKSATSIDTNIISAKMSVATYNYRTLVSISNSIGQKFNEKLLTSEDRITIL